MARESSISELLIIEDNQDQIAMLKSALAEWSERNKIKIDCAATAVEALDRISSGSYSVILMDCRLPDKNAFDLFAQIKASGFKIPTILMISAGEEEFAVNALKMGFADYLVKAGNSFRSLPQVLDSTFKRFQKMKEERKLQTELADKNVQLRSMNQKLVELAVRDELTGLYNHRFFQERMTEEFARAARYHYPLSCLVIDIDHFKQINDTHGHFVGDEILKELAIFLSSRLRQADTVARFGGEEFVVLLPYVGYEGSALLAERLRKKIMDQLFAVQPNLGLKLTVSIGLASYPEDPVDRKETLLFYADKALYRAKGSGRNRVYLYRSLTREYADKIPEVRFKSEKVQEFRQRLFDVSEMAKRAYIEATKALINALEAKDVHTMGHAARVGSLSATLAREMGLSEDDVRIIEHAGLLHDIGKICILDEVLLKPAAYNENEYEQMKDHAILGYQIVKPVKFLSEEALIILNHHEWYNGKGYPNGVAGKEIPLGARIVSVLDAYDTMRTAGGRYKRTLNCEEAVRELIDFAGTQFDPEVVLQFVKVLLKKGDLRRDAYDREKLNRSVKQLAA